jgi:hypothetical protein
MDVQQLKLLAGRIRGLLEQSGTSISHNQALDTAAALVGLRNWPEVQAFADHVAAADLDTAASSRLAYRLKKRHQLDFDAQQLLDALRPPFQRETAVAPTIWPGGPPAGVYLTTAADHISALMDAYEDATDGALVYAESAGGRADNCIDLGDYGLWSSGLDRVPSGTLLVVGPVELHQQSWSEAADRLNMACLHACNSGHRVAVLVDTETPQTLFHDVQLMVRSKNPEGDDLHAQISGEVSAEGELVPTRPFAEPPRAPSATIIGASVDGLPAPAREDLRRAFERRRTGLVMVGSSELKEHRAIELVEGVLALSDFAGPAARIRPRRRSTPAKDWMVPDAIKALPFLPSVQSAYSLGYRRMIVTTGYTDGELLTEYGSDVLFIAGTYGASVDDVFMDVVRMGGRDAEVHALEQLIGVVALTRLKTSRLSADLLDSYVHDGWRPRGADKFGEIVERLRGGRTRRAEDELEVLLASGKVTPSTVKKNLPRVQWVSEYLAQRSASTS